jgi:hypothetical protein
MQYLAAITQTFPPTLHFSLYNSENNPVYIPRLLGPLGYFITVEIMDENNKVVYRSSTPKAKPKLYPSKPESYQTLEPGYTCGIVLTVEGYEPAPGEYRVSIKYSNLEFRGFPGHSLGKLTYSTMLSFHVG